MTVRNNLRTADWNPGRVLSALGRIGYSPASAILDLVDNSVSNGANRIDIRLTVEKAKTAESKATRAVLSSIIISDNGIGMSEQGLCNAISLGSPATDYCEGTLSKFGLGLKAAAASLGRKLEIISRDKSSPNTTLTATLDHALIESEGKYVYTLANSLPDEMTLLNEIAGAGSGTTIRISELNRTSLPSTSTILEALKHRTGIVYYYYLKGTVPGRAPLKIFIDQEEIFPLDPLFIDHIDSESPNLNEYEWTGLNTQWITSDFEIQLDPESLASARVDITQLPHPPSVGQQGLISAKQCRDNYMIGAGNYGFYIYRNYRLISWADSLQLIQPDQDLYSFRGRLLLDNSADDLLNIDVSKSRIELSEIARTQLEPELREAVKKSRIAWQTAGRRVQLQTDSDPHMRMNEALDRIGKLEENEEKLDESVTPEPEREQLQQRKEFAIKAKPIGENESEKLRESGQRVQYVDSLDNNQLWERAHDPQLGQIVRINSSHRFFREYIQSHFDNVGLVNACDLLFYALARGEYNLVHKSNSNKPEVIDKLMDEYRERVGNGLSDYIRSIEK